MLYNIKMMTKPVNDFTALKSFPNILFMSKQNPSAIAEIIATSETEKGNNNSILNMEGMVSFVQRTERHFYTHLRNHGVLITSRLISHV